MIGGGDVYDVHRLRILREVRLRGTLAAVASALGYSPSAISHQLSILELETGATLLESVGRGVRLTPTALALVTHAENVLRELVRAEATVAAHRTDVVGTVRVATFQTAAWALVPAAVRSLAERHPGLELAFTHVAAETAVAGLLARDVDIALTERFPGEVPLRHDGVTVTPLLDDPLVLATPASWRPAEPVAPAVLAGRPWAMEHEGTGARTWTERVCHDAGFVPRIVAETDDVRLHVHLVRSGIVAAFVPALGLVTEDGIVTTPTGEHRSIGLAVRSGGERAPAVVAACDALAASVRHVSEVRSGRRSRTTR
ncbi:LysR family transcriptional regulator [Pseudoclavibacter chungangensis]|uniref:LysR family transcriptional regulator n=1 Tax=Pseudoclavibacter chungangensis TaxID=587635 RepID=UPI001C54B4ED|nr:LysR family transcriptional regulator [Pseudoclavibacter chungangensis]